MTNTAISDPHADSAAGREGHENTAEPPALKEDLSGKASLNAIAAALEYAARVVVGFLIKPLLLFGLGDYGFGAWNILGQLIGYLAPAGGRAGHALRWSVAQQQASTEYLEKRKMVGSALAVWLMFLPILLGLGLIIVWGAPLWLRAADELVWPIRIAALILLVDMIAVNLVEIPRSVLEGENLGYKRMGFSALLVGAGGGLTLLALHLQMGIAGVAAATLATTCLTGVFFFSVVRSYVTWFGFAKPTWQSVRKFFGLSGWFVAWFLVAKLMRASDVVVLGLAASVELVSSYTLTKFVPETVVSLVAIIVFGVTPGLGGIFGKGDLQRAARVRGELMALTWLVATLVGATTVLWNRSFLQLWVGSEYDTGAAVTALIVVMMTQFVILRTDGNIIDLTLDLKQKVIMGFISTIISLVGAAILVGYFHQGMLGLCLGMIGGRLVLSVCYPLIVGKKLNISFRSQSVAAIRPLLVSVSLIAGAAWLSQYWRVTSWPMLVVVVGITVVVTPLPVFLAGLPGAARQRMIERLRKVLSSARRRKT